MKILTIIELRKMKIDWGAGDYLCYYREHALSTLKDAQRLLVCQNKRGIVTHILPLGVNKNDPVYDFEVQDIEVSNGNIGFRGKGSIKIKGLLLEE